MSMGTASLLGSKQSLGSTANVPDGFAIVSAGSIDLTAGGTSENITLKNATGGGTIIDFNGGTPPTPFNAASVQIIGANSTQPSAEFASFANNSRLLLRRANGTLASPTALLSGESIGAVSWGGRGATGYVAAFAGYGAFAEENFTDTAAGMKLTAAVILVGGTTGYTVTDLSGRGQFIAGSGGNKTISAWGFFGAISSFSNSAGAGFTITDNSSSGTVATAVANSFSAPTFAASSATTFTDAASVYIAGPVSAGTNVTLTRSHALWIDSGSFRLDGTDGAAAASGTLTNAPSAGNPDKWIPINSDGTQYWIPAWAA